MKNLDDVLAELGPADRDELLGWVEAAWVRPERASKAPPRFAPIDVARLRLIRELRDELALDPEAIPIVLSLLDRVYGLRRQLAAAVRAMGEAPEEVRATLLSRCRLLLAEVEEQPRPRHAGHRRR